MPPPGRPRYRFAEFTLSPARRALVRSGREVPLIPRYLDLLLLLVERRAVACTARRSSTACGRTWWSPTAPCPRRSGRCGARSASSGERAVHPHGVPPRLPVRVPRRGGGGRRAGRASLAGRAAATARAAARQRPIRWRPRSPVSSIPRRPTRRAGTPPRSCTLSARRRPCAGSTAGRATPGPGRTCATAGGTSRARGRCRSSRPRRARPRGPRSWACVSSAPGAS